MHCPKRPLPQHRTRNLKLLVVFLLLVSGWWIGLQKAVAQRQASGSGDGAVLFRLTCASSYCHGEQGRGGG
ncbi:MAG: hypothetical protein ABI882_21705, partial [Acidobacteriota bacterium]